MHVIGHSADRDDSAAQLLYFALNAPVGDTPDVTVEKWSPAPGSPDQVQVNLDFAATHCVLPN